MGSQNPERDRPSLADHLNLREWALEYPGWTLSVSCKQCVHSGTLDLKRLLKGPYPPRRMGELKARLYCPKCQGRVFTMKAQFLIRRE